MELLVRYLDRSSSVSSASSQDVVKDQSLRDDLNFYFMNPCEKYQARQHIPWKLGVQILKIVLITAQLIMFGLNNQLVVTFKQENMMALKYLFVRGYSGADEDDYCTSVYTQQDAYQSLSFVLDQYSNLGKLSVGPINYADDEDGNLLPMLLCKEQYRKGSVEPSGKMYDIDSEVEKVCLTFDPKMAKHWKTHNASFFDLDFSRLVDIKFTFKLKTINLQTVRYRELPDCYSFYIMILFDNQFHSGKLRITLDIDTYSFACKNWKISGTAQKNTHYLLVFDSLVIAVCLTSAVLCARSMLLAIKLLQRFSRYLQEASGQQVCEDDQKEFLSGWYLLVIVSDLMAIIGSILKIEIQAKSMTNYDVCSIFLGTATLLVWVSAIRYLGYFEKYNVLILTMKVAFPKVLRFCCCAGMIYMGYTFCGWIVLGPYHEKFEQLNRVAECLFSLLNGDDMFATFALLKDKNSLVWYFSRAYLYTFISMFIYMVLSLFIGLITDSYEIVTSSQREEPNTPLHKFLREPSGLPAATEKGHVYVPVSCYLFGCCQRASVVDDD